MCTSLAVVPAPLPSPRGARFAASSTASRRMIDDMMEVSPESDVVCVAHRSEIIVFSRIFHAYVIPSLITVICNSTFFFMFILMNAFCKLTDIRGAEKHFGVNLKLSN